MSVARSHRRIRLAGCAVHGQLVLELDLLVEALPCGAQNWRRAEKIKGLARVRLRKRWRFALSFFSQGFRPGLGVCRAYGAVRRNFKLKISDSKWRQRQRIRWRDDALRSSG